MMGLYPTLTQINTKKKYMFQNMVGNERFGGDGHVEEGEEGMRKEGTRGMGKDRDKGIIVTHTNNY